MSLDGGLTRPSPGRSTGSIIGDYEWDGHWRTHITGTHEDEAEERRSEGKGHRRPMAIRPLGVTPGAFLQQYIFNKTAPRKVEGTLCLGFC